jgi:hypothetical protein
MPPERSWLLGYYMTIFGSFLPYDYLFAGRPVDWESPGSHVKFEKPGTCFMCHTETHFISLLFEAWLCSWRCERRAFAELDRLTRQIDETNSYI